ncbi:MAG: Gfo/Idh/MocA family oxidoreductase, partial [Pseudomonadota bacterium]
MRYGLIGCGMMGGEHIRNLHLLRDAHISALADPDDYMLDAAKTLSASQPKIFSDYRDLLAADDFDALIIAAPNDLHHGIMKDALGLGKPVLCEKPLCTTSADCYDLIRLAGNTPVWVAMEYRFMPPVQRLLGCLQDGSVGKTHMLAIREHRFPFLEKIGDWNRFNRRTGGTMIEKCCHFWDLMRLILKSDPVRIYASAAMDVNHRTESYDGETPDIIDNGFVVIDFANGMRGMLDLCMFGEGAAYQEEISVTGDAGRVEAL